uniref:Uncharacterized protein n=1 Tax=Timema bartmani TaxID=61472 RepID=A0A7R9F626_9NEOP|nr:unnamed protein product [Timema bartmani]
MCSDNSRLLLLLTIYSLWVTEVSSVFDVLIKKEDSFNKILEDYIENTIRSPDPWFEKTEDRRTPSLENNPENISARITNVTPNASLFGPILPHKDARLSNRSEGSAIGNRQDYSQEGDTLKVAGSSVASGSSSYHHGSTSDYDEPKKSYPSKRQKRGLGLLLGLGAIMLHHHHNSHHHHHHPHHSYNHLDRMVQVPVAPPVLMTAPVYPAAVYPPPVYPPSANPSPEQGRRKVPPSSTDQLRVVLPPGYVEEPCCLTNN